MTFCNASSGAALGTSGPSRAGRAGRHMQQLFCCAHQFIEALRVRERTRRAETRCSNVAPSAWALRPADPEPTRQRGSCRGTPKTDVIPISRFNFLGAHSIVRPAPRTFLHPDRQSQSRRAQTRSRPGVALHAQQTPKLPACALTVASTAAGSISGYRRRADICLLGWAFSAPGY